MTIQQLQYVVALDTHRHFVKAAESCHVAQPTLTLQVKKLEDQMSLVLFDRSSQPLKPTAMGEIFIAKARQILRDLQQLKALVNEELNQIEGIYRVGIIPTLAPYLLPLFVKDFMDKYPDTKLKIQELQSESIIHGLEHDLLDIGILATPLNEPNIREIPIFYEPFLVYADQQNDILKGSSEVEIKELGPEGLWLLGQGHCFRNQTLNVCRFDELENKRNLLMEGGSIETLKKMINEVLGYTLIPELSYDEKHDKKNVLRFKAPQPVREISIVTHKSFTKELLISELRKSIIACTPPSFKKNTKFVTVKWR